jgi:hypothetical protein
MCLANVTILVGQVETSSQSDYAQPSPTVVLSPDVSAVHRIIIASAKNKVHPPPIIHAVQMPQHANDTEVVRVVDGEEQDNAHQQQGNDEEKDGKQKEEEEEENDDEEESGDDEYWLGDDEYREESSSLDEPEDKSPIIQILREAGIDDIDNETLAALPTWKEVTRLYGSKPRIHGLETSSCRAFQQHSHPADHFLGVAGCFNSGTNLLSELLIHNCLMTKRMETYGPQNKGIRWQVPWGKHSPPLNEEFRTRHKTKPGDENIQAHNVFAAVTIRDPYVWMRSMCRHPYGAYWPNDTGHCPNLIPNELDVKKEPWLQYKQSVPIDVQYSEFNRQHESLVHFWNEWYAEYLQAPFPRLIVRFEDLIFHAKEVTTQVCNCAGGTMQPRFSYIQNSAKKGTPGAHGKDGEKTSFIDAIVKYGKETSRLDGFTADDIAFARSHLNLKLMDLFGYPFDEPPQSIQ